MDKAEYKVKLEEINSLAEAGDFRGAAAVMDTIEWKHIKSVRTLCMVGEIYEAVRRYDDSKRILTYAYNRSSASKSVLYRLTEINIRMGNYDEAELYFAEFEKVAPNDSSRYILKYKLLRARNASVAEQIEVLRAYKEHEYTERWAYELARLYKKNGQDKECVAECDDMILWFADGKYVMKAMELKMQIQPLTDSQQKKYNSQFKKAETTYAAQTGSFAGTGSQSRDALLENLTGSQRTSAADAISRLEAAADATVSGARRESTEPNVTPGVRSSFRNENSQAIQSQLASSIRAVFSGLRPQGTPAEDVPKSPLFDMSEEAAARTFATREELSDEVAIEEVDLASADIPALESDDMVEGTGTVITEPVREDASLVEAERVIAETELTEDMARAAAREMAEVQADIGSEVVRLAGEMKTEAEQTAAAENEAAAEAASELSAGVTAVAAAAEEAAAESAEEAAEAVEETVAATAEEAAEAAEEVAEAVEETVAATAEEAAEAAEAVEETVAATAEEAAEAVEETAAATVEETVETAEETAVELVEEVAAVAGEKAEEAAEAAAGEAVTAAEQAEPEKAAEEESFDLEALFAETGSIFAKDVASGQFRKMDTVLDGEPETDISSEAEALAEEIAENEEAAAAVEEAAAPVEEAAEEAAEGAKETAEEAAEAVEETVEEAVKAEEAVAEEAVGTAEETAVEAVEAVEETAEETAEAAEAAVEEAAETAEETAEEAVVAVEETAEETAEAAEAAVEEAAETVEETVEEAVVAAEKAAEETAEAAEGSVETAVEEVEKAVAEAVGAAEEAAEETTEAAEGSVEAAVEEVEKAVAEASGAAEEAAEEAAEAAEGSVEAAVEEVAEAAEEAAEAVEETAAETTEVVEAVPEKSAEAVVEATEESAEAVETAVEEVTETAAAVSAEAESAAEDAEAAVEEAASKAITGETDESLGLTREFHFAREMVYGTEAAQEDAEAAEAETPETASEENMEEAETLEESTAAEEAETEAAPEEAVVLGGTKEFPLQEVREAREAAAAEIAEAAAGAETVGTAEAVAAETVEAFAAEAADTAEAVTTEAAETAEAVAAEAVETAEAVATEAAETAEEASAKAAETVEAGAAKTEETTEAAATKTEESAPAAKPEKPARLPYVPVEPRAFTETEAGLFSYLAGIPGIREQVTSAVADVHNNAGDKTSKSGNILVMGRSGNGKSRMTDGLILAICADLGIKTAKVAKINADEFNRKDVAAAVKTMSGGFLVIERASRLATKTMATLSQAMEFRTDALTVILEDDKYELIDTLSRNPGFAEKFTSRIVIPVFTNDELVTFAKVYTEENGCHIDEMGTLALYTIIGENQKEGEPITVGFVKDLVDQAMTKAKKRRFRKAKDSQGRILIREKDFPY